MSFSLTALGSTRREGLRSIAHYGHAKSESKRRAKRRKERRTQKARERENNAGRQKDLDIGERSSRPRHEAYILCEKNRKDGTALVVASFRLHQSPSHPRFAHTDARASVGRGAPNHRPPQIIGSQRAGSGAVAAHASPPHASARICLAATPKLAQFLRPFTSPASRPSCPRAKQMAFLPPLPTVSPGPPSQEAIRNTREFEVRDR